MRTDQTEPETNVHYQIAVANGHSFIRGDAWSGYYERLSLWHNGDLPEGEAIYGLPQAREHVAELRATDATDEEYKEYWSTVKLTIQRVTTTTENVETF